MTARRALLEEGRRCLKDCGIADADTDSWLLLSYCTGFDRLDYLLNPQALVPDEEVSRYRALLKQRAEGMPLQYITGEQEFMGLTFKVNPHVLIPRQDTEVLVETVISRLRAASMDKEPSVLDMCTGSGCILLSIMAFVQCSFGDGADLSEPALEVARENERRLRRLGRRSLPECGGPAVRFIQSDLFENIHDRYDVIVSNPPYIPSAQIQTLMTEVRAHEPVMALDGSDDGLAFYRRITASAAAYLNRGGMIFFEIGWDQAEPVCQLLKNEGFCEIHVKKDLAGLDRVVYARLP